jgi:hypothetical protein
VTPFADARRPADARPLADAPPGAPNDPAPVDAAASAPAAIAAATDVEPIHGDEVRAEVADPASPAFGARQAPVPAPVGHHPERVPARPPARSSGPTNDHDDGSEHGATGPQLRRFIKSRAYVPMHELRRRFAIVGGDDEVTPMDLERRRVFVGLPEREGRLLAELLRGGDIGYELSLDPISPIVVGVYPMRPVTRP